MTRMARSTKEDVGSDEDNQPTRLKEDDYSTSSNSSSDLTSGDP